MTFADVQKISSLREIFKLSTPYVLLAFLVYIVVSYVRAWYHLRHFKGPWLGSFSYIFMGKTNATGRMFQIWTDVSNKYGSLARIGPNDLLTDDPEIIKFMSSARSAYRRSEFYDAMRIDPYVDNILSELDTTVHDKRRAKMANAYAGKENPSIESDIDSQIASFISLIRQKYLSSGSTLRPLDFGRTAQYFTLDVITKVAYGHAFGYLEKDEDLHEYIKTSEELLVYITFGSVWPTVNWILNRGWIRENFGPSAKDKYGVGKLMGVAREVTAERFGPNAKEQRDMMGAFVRNGIPQRQIESEVLLQIIAGSDTTATAIRATMLYLITSPRILPKLLAEIDEAISTGRISSPVTNTESKTLPYLQACIKEGLRMHPPFTGMISKKVPPGGDSIKGQFVPGGTRISHSTWAVMRRKDYFGEDADLFRPERWIEAWEEEERAGGDKEKAVRMEQTVDLCFGYGRWGCLGRSVALLELNKVFVELLRNFEFEVIRPDKPWRSVNYNLFMQDQMWMRVTEREGKKA